MTARVWFSEKWQRDVGPGVPAMCDHPGCDERITRGDHFVCGPGSGPSKGSTGCGLYFCPLHRYDDLCEMCHLNLMDCFTPTPDVPEWIRYKATSPEWEMHLWQTQILNDEGHE